MTQFLSTKVGGEMVGNVRRFVGTDRRKTISEAGEIVVHLPEEVYIGRDEFPVLSLEAREVADEPPFDVPRDLRLVSELPTRAIGFAGLAPRGSLAPDD